MKKFSSASFYSLAALLALGACHTVSGPRSSVAYFQPEEKNSSDTLPGHVRTDDLDWHLTKPVRTLEVDNWCRHTTKDHMQGSGGTVSGTSWDVRQKETYFCAIPLIGSRDYQNVVVKFVPLADRRGYFQADLAHLPAMSYTGFTFTPITLYQLKDEFRKNNRFKQSPLWSEDRAPRPYASPKYWPCYVGWPFGMTQPASALCHPDLQENRLPQSQLDFTLPNFKP